MKAIKVWANFFNTNLIASAILWIIIILVACGVIATLINMLSYTSRILEAIAIKKQHESEMAVNDGLKKLNLDEEITCTSNLMEFVHKMIQDECVTYLHPKILLNEPYAMLYADDDIKKIANTVFNGLNPEMYSSKNQEIIITKDYLMSYITKETSVIFFEAVTTHNEIIRGGKTNKDENEE